jgi:hypothetical protein
VGRLLQTGRDVRCIANGRVIHPEVVADAADHDWPCVEADPHPDGRTLAGLDLAAQIADRALDAKCGVPGAACAILVRDGHPKESHHAVARVLVDRALEPVDLGSYRLEAPVHNLVNVLWVAFLSQAREPRDVCEQHGDLAALALDRRPRLEHLIGKVLGRVRSDRPGGRGNCRRCQRVFEEGDARSTGTRDGTTRWPHPPQNRAPARSTVAHCGQRPSRAAPHWSQNRLAAGLSVWQEEHSIAGTSRDSISCAACSCRLGRHSRPSR